MVLFTSGVSSLKLSYYLSHERLLSLYFGRIYPKILEFQFSFFWSHVAGVQGKRLSIQVMRLNYTRRRHLCLDSVGTNQHVCARNRLTHTSGLVSVTAAILNLGPIRTKNNQNIWFSFDCHCHGTV